MSREGKTKFAMLGFLSWGPMSGYDLRAAVERSVGHLWSESFGQIYPILKKLEQEGLAERTIEYQEGRPDRHVYAVTPAGREALHAWLLTPSSPTRLRVEVVLKLLFASRLSRAECLAHIARFEAEQRGANLRFRAARKRLETEARERAELPFWLLTVDCGLKVSQAFLEWCVEAKRLIESVPMAP